MSHLHNVQEIADLLVISPKTVRRYIASGSLEAIRLSRRQFRVSQEALARFLKENTTSPFPQAAAVEAEASR